MERKVKNRPRRSWETGMGELKGVKQSREIKKYIIVK